MATVIVSEFEAKHGPVRILAFLTDPKVTAAILMCLGLPSTPPPLAPARAPPQAELAFGEGFA